METDIEHKMKALLKMESHRRKPGNSKALVCPWIPQKYNYSTTGKDKLRDMSKTAVAE